MRSKKRYKKNAWSTEKSEWPGQKWVKFGILTSYWLRGWWEISRPITEWRKVRPTLLSTSQWNCSTVDTTWLYTQPTYTLPHCNVISLRYSDETYFPEYNVKMSSGLVASGPTAFSAMQNTAWRFSVKPCVRIINWIIIIINFQTLYIAVGKLWHLGIWYHTGASRRKLTDG